MPELPEVETVASDLGPVLARRAIRSVDLRLSRVLRYPAPAVFRRRLSGRTIEGLTRHGKLMAIHLQGGDRLYVHLGMTGQLTVCDPVEPIRKHTHLLLTLTDGLQLRFADQRQFGRLLLGTERELRTAGVLPRLGPDPLTEEFTLERFSALLARRRRPVKAVLLDQSLIAGLGNIYADESCFVARVRPTRSVGRLRVAERRALYGAIRSVLHKSIRNRGSSVDNYRDGYGGMGSHQEHLLVYGRAGAPCVACGTALKKVRFAGRGTVYCPRCQR